MKLNEIMSISDENKLIPAGVKAYKALNKYLDKFYSDNEWDGWIEEIFYDTESKSFFVDYFLENEKGQEFHKKLEITFTGKVSEKKFNVKKLVDLNQGDFIADITEKLTESNELIEGKIDRSAAQNPEVLPKGHVNWTAAEKRAFKNNEEMPFNTDIKNAIKRLKNILADKSNYKVGDSGDAYSLSVSELTGNEDGTVLAMYTNKNPLVDFYWVWNKQWFNSKGEKLTAKQLIQDMKKFDTDTNGWADYQLKFSAKKRLFNKS